MGSSSSTFSSSDAFRASSWNHHANPDRIRPTESRGLVGTLTHHLSTSLYGLANPDLPFVLCAQRPLGSFVPLSRDQTRYHRGHSKVREIIGIDADLSIAALVMIQRIIIIVTNLSLTIMGRGASFSLSSSVEEVLKKAQTIHQSDNSAR